jgi:hypothetical protein
VPPASPPVGNAGRLRDIVNARRTRLLPGRPDPGAPRCRRECSSSQRWAAGTVGYGLGIFRFRGSGLVFGLVLLAFMIPFQAVLIAMVPCIVVYVALQRYCVRGLSSGALKG